MTIEIFGPRKALNKSYLKVKPQREEIERFKANLIQLLDQIDEKESEEFHKIIISNFLNNTYYSGNHYINTKGRNDLVIHNGKDAKSTVGVIIETKKPTNKTEMVSADNLNVKAFQELVLYYLRERVTHGNLEIKHLLITNIHEWFFFDAVIFEKAFVQNKSLVKHFQEFEEGRLAGKNTDFFYKDIAAPAIKEFFADLIKSGRTLPITYFDIREYEKILRNKDKADDNKLIALFKLLSPEHLLKLPFKNDSNSLDKAFYVELLHIIGLTEIKDGSKKIIDRKEAEKRDEGSILENVITQLESLDKLSRLDKPTQFGLTIKDRYFNVGLELVITWVNRILFLKLLEAQLITYHKGDKSYSFLNKEQIKSFDDLNSLFFQVLAKESKDRTVAINKIFNKVPYLNSSLFEPSDLEQVCFPISQLQDSKELPILSITVLKNNVGKKRTGNLNALEYLFDFLDAYDFSSEGSEEIQEENKTLINASVLGLIFEKINGYKDGSFFTPGFITMYMCRETIRRAVIQKFNEFYKWKCETLDDVHNHIEKDKLKEANEVINSLRICDPAVGSGHFLVSALNEIIAIKSYLKILTDSQGKRLKDYNVEVENDELTVTDEDGKLFEYNPKNKESQRIQETLFHEKQTLIENCLFGVDINTNSVKICRLRLWIELLKNAYYKTGSNDTELETLPNIDINIKCGNSLISRFPLDADLSQALKKSKITIKKYRESVQNYRHATSKDQKREMETLIAKIKGDFRTEISNNDPKVKKLRSKRGDLDKLLNQHLLFELTKPELKERKELQLILEAEVQKLSNEIEEIKSNKIFENAFEWRFEFPEVLDDKGQFAGFDLIIGNPPYIGGREWNLPKIEFDYYLSRYESAEYQFDAYILFWDLSRILSSKIISLITPNTWLNNQKNKLVRKNILEWDIIEIADYSKIKVFEDATVLPIITILRKDNQEGYLTRVVKPSENKNELLESNLISKIIWEKDPLYIFNIDLSTTDLVIRNNIEKNAAPLETFANIKFGIKIYETGKGTPKQIASDAKNRIYESDKKEDKSYRRYLEGKDVSTYAIHWQNRWLKYGPNLAAPRSADLFEGQRILVRRIIGERLIASFTDEDYVTSQLLQIVKPNEEIYSKAILAILNSKMMAYYFRKKYNRQDITFPEIRIYELASLPIIIPDNPKQFNSLVDKAIAGKSLNQKADISEIEKEIDFLVYKLYALTKDEIDLIEQGL